MKPLTKDNFHRMCRDVKDYVEKNYDLPVKVTYNGVDYYQIEMAYAMAYGLYHLKSDFNIPNFGKWRNLKGEHINVNVKLNEIKDQCRRVYNHILNNEEAPSSVLVKADKNYLISTKVWIYCIAKTVVYNDTNKQLPLQTLYNSDAFNKPAPKPTVKKYGRSVETGCDDRGQNNGYYCGPHMVQEIIRNLTGIVVPQSILASIIGTTTNGSDHQGINTSFAWFNRKYDKNLQVEWKNFSEVGWSGINNILKSNNRDCGLHELYRDTWGHYTNFDAIYNSTIDVHNSLGSTCSRGCYCGYTENRSKSTAERYLRGISQKSVIIVTNKG